MNAQEEYVFDFPVLVTVDHAAMRTHGLPAALKLATYSDYGTVFPVFTEDLIAERYLEDSRLAGTITRQIDTAAELAGLARVAQNAGVQLAAFDIAVKPCKHRGLEDIGHLIRRLEKAG
jgi:hypothetical protein